MLTEQLCIMDGMVEIKRQGETGTWSHADSLSGSAARDLSVGGH